MSSGMHATGLKCVRCGQELPLVWDHPTHNHPGRDDDVYYGYLEVTYDYAAVSDFPSAACGGLSRYLALLPVDALRVSLGEGSTPLKLLTRVFRQHKVFVKDESRNPTGCFKDREAVVAINAAVDRGIREVFVVSSGNGACSIAAYASKAGIQCTCHVPEKTSIQKRQRIELYGGRLEYHPGDYEDIYRMSIDRCFPGWNCTPGINPLSIEGAKTIAFELWEEIGVPDRVLVPCGNGTGLAGIWKGFKELQRLGKINKLPQMIGVQLDTASPLQAAWSRKVDYITLVEIADCPIAGGILARESYTAPLAIRAMQESDGFVVLVSESEIVQAQREVEQQELLVPESTSASVYAAARKLADRLKPSDITVCVQTAGGVRNVS